MAAQTCTHSQTATLSTTNADGITFSGRGNRLRVTNHHATEKLYFRIDSTTPVAAADETYICLAGGTVDIPFLGQVCGVVGNGNIYTVSIYSV